MISCSFRLVVRFARDSQGTFAQFSFVRSTSTSSSSSSRLALPGRGFLSEKRRHNGGGMENSLRT